LIPLVDAVICVSEQQRRYYQTCYPHQQFFTAVTGVKPVSGVEPRTHCTGTIGYLGTFDERTYDFELMMGAFARVPRPDLRLLVVGSRSESEMRAMQQIAERHGVAGRVDVLPWQSPRELQQVKCRLDVGLAPLAVSGRGRMCSPLKILEYLSGGIPVVASAAEGVEAIVENGRNGYVVAPSQKAWAEAIGRIVADDAVLAEMSRASLEAAERFSWERRAGRIVDFLKSLGKR
jgi:glycosyltransferase involved in cell wall biosynthesis